MTHTHTHTYFVCLSSSLAFTCECLAQMVEVSCGGKAVVGVWLRKCRLDVPIGKPDLRMVQRYNGAVRRYKDPRNMWYVVCSAIRP